MRIIKVFCGAYAGGSHTLLAASQAPVVGTALTLTGTQPDTLRRIALVAGNDVTAARTFTLIGTDTVGNVITEVMTVPSGAGTVISNLDYKTITRATPTGAAWSANITLGTCITGTDAPIASSPWVRTDDYGFPDVAMQVDVTGTANWTIEASVDDANVLLPQTPITPAAMVWIAHPVAASQTTSQQASYGPRPAWIRLTINSATATTGAANLSVSQAGGKFG